MKVILAGSRNINDEFSVRCYFDSVYLEGLSEVVSGGARGVDSFGPDIARERKAKSVIFEANWGLHGKVAGLIRNEQMALYADALVAVWDGKSRGTRHMIDTMLDLGKHTHVFICK